MDYLILGLAIVLNASANIMMKVGMVRLGKQPTVMALAIKAATSPIIIAGIFCFVGALALYMTVLQKMNLSIAYPIMTSVGYMIVILISWLFLKEQLQLIQVIGFFLIIGGVWLVAA